jgi:proline dehydrogenase
MSSGATASRSYDPPVRLVDRLIATSLPAVPRPVVRRFADRYMAGERLDDAITTVTRLNRLGASATVDVLGEFVHDRAQAAATVEQYLEALDAIARTGLDANVSVKLTAVGLEIQPALALGNVRKIVEHAASLGNFVRIDMEHSAVTDETLDVYTTLRREGFDNVGIVLQSCMRRSVSDVRSMAALRPRVRLVKGIYVEPPSIAYTTPAQINASFERLIEELADIGSHVAAATHDEQLIAAMQRVARERSLSRDLYEFQMLLGVREGLRDRLLASGERVRIYVPYGDAWYGYSIRRLKENPSIAGYVAQDVARRLVGR